MFMVLTAVIVTKSLREFTRFTWRMIDIQLSQIVYLDDYTDEHLPKRVAKFYASGLNML